jgi:gluconokinase
VWLQIVADVLDSALEVPRIEEAVAYGAALLAFRALGLIDDLDAMADQVEIARTVAPDPANARRYDDVARRYADLVERLEPLLRDEGMIATEQQ